MTTALILAVALVLGLLGGWGAYRLLSHRALDPAERFALTLALFPAMLGLAAFAGLLAGRPGPLLPSVLCVILGLLGAVSTRRPQLPTSVVRTAVSPGGKGWSATMPAPSTFTAGS